MQIRGDCTNEFSKSKRIELSDDSEILLRCDVIEDIHRNNVNNENLGWEKGVYPSDDFLQNSLIKG